MLTTYGSPPLNPVHPSHNNPAPASIRRMLFGGNLSLSLFSRGPTCKSQILQTLFHTQYAAVKPATPEDKWITYPPE
ncbi:hypothetical protein PanWU01x14_199900 [Parasponia andersonii]|uniref:Uncharacterized protein n=1 Tax=Parasponia andersonii TaxID=3476 RepID=A0A2P5BYE9_PARAD|nr:hypothetical protein PanWU01x14_199900 [Parasponia andersonii]